MQHQLPVYLLVRLTQKSGKDVLTEHVHIAMPEGGMEYDELVQVCRNLARRSNRIGVFHAEPSIDMYLLNREDGHDERRVALSAAACAEVTRALRDLPPPTASTSLIKVLHAEENVQLEAAVETQASQLSRRQSASAYFRAAQIVGASLATASPSSGESGTNLSSSSSSSSSSASSVQKRPREDGVDLDDGDGDGDGQLELARLRLAYLDKFQGAVELSKDGKHYRCMLLVDAGGPQKKNLKANINRQVGWGTSPQALTTCASRHGEYEVPTHSKGGWAQYDRIWRHLQRHEFYLYSEWESVGGKLSQRKEKLHLPILKDQNRTTSTEMVPFIGAAATDAIPTQLALLQHVLDGLKAATASKKKKTKKTHNKDIRQMLQPQRASPAACASASDDAQHDIVLEDENDGDDDAADVDMCDCDRSDDLSYLQETAVLAEMVVHAGGRLRGTLPMEALRMYVLNVLPPLTALESLRRSSQQFSSLTAHSVATMTLYGKNALYHQRGPGGAGEGASVSERQATFNFGGLHPRTIRKRFGFQFSRMTPGPLLGFTAAALERLSATTSSKIKTDWTVVVPVVVLFDGVPIAPAFEFDHASALWIGLKDGPMSQQKAEDVLSKCGEDRTLAARELATSLNVTMFRTLDDKSHTFFMGYDFLGRSISMEDIRSVVDPYVSAFNTCVGCLKAGISCHLPETCYDCVAALRSCDECKKQGFTEKDWHPIRRRCSECIRSQSRCIRGLVVAISSDAASYQEKLSAEFEAAARKAVDSGPVEFAGMLPQHPFYVIDLVHLLKAFNNSMTNHFLSLGIEDRIYVVNRRHVLAAHQDTQSGLVDLSTKMKKSQLFNQDRHDPQAFTALLQDCVFDTMPREPMGVALVPSFFKPHATNLPDALEHVSVMVCTEEQHAVLAFLHNRNVAKFITLHAPPVAKDVKVSGFRESECIVSASCSKSMSSAGDSIWSVTNFGKLARALVPKSLARKKSATLTFSQVETLSESAEPLDNFWKLVSTFRTAVVLAHKTSVFISRQLHPGPANPAQRLLLKEVDCQGKGDVIDVSIAGELLFVLFDGKVGICHHDNGEWFAELPCAGSIGLEVFPDRSILVIHTNRLVWMPGEWQRHEDLHTIERYESALLDDRATIPVEGGMTRCSFAHPIVTRIGCSFAVYDASSSPPFLRFFTSMKPAWQFLRPLSRISASFGLDPGGSEPGMTVLNRFHGDKGTEAVIKFVRTLNELAETRTSRTREGAEGPQGFTSFTNRHGLEQLSWSIDRLVQWFQLCGEDEALKHMHLKALLTLPVEYLFGMARRRAASSVAKSGREQLQLLSNAVSTSLIRSFGSEHTTVEASCGYGTNWARPALGDWGLVSQFVEALQAQEIRRPSSERSAINTSLKTMASRAVQLLVKRKQKSTRVNGMAPLGTLPTENVAPTVPVASSSKQIAKEIVIDEHELIVTIPTEGDEQAFWLLLSESCAYDCDDSVAGTWYEPSVVGGLEYHLSSHHEMVDLDTILNLDKHVEVVWDRMGSTEGFSLKDSAEYEFWARRVRNAFRRRDGLQPAPGDESDDGSDKE